MVPLFQKVAPKSATEATAPLPWQSWQLIVAPQTTLLPVPPWQVIFEQVLPAAVQVAVAPALAVSNATSMVPAAWTVALALMAVPVVVVLVWQVAQSVETLTCLAWLLAVATPAPPLA